MVLPLCEFGLPRDYARPRLTAQHPRRWKSVEKIWLAWRAPDL